MLTKKEKNWEITVARATPNTLQLRYSTKVRSKMMLMTQLRIRKYSGDLESPRERSSAATPLYSATATMPKLVTRR